jgi:signal recognition particle subunit SRP54
VKTVIGRPIAFAATGEKIDAFEQFHPDRMAGRILGMGDMLTLIEQAEKVFEQDKAEEAAQRMLEGQFTLEDFLDQLQQLKKMGPLSGIMGMLPGMPKEMKNAEIGDDQVKVTEAIIRSMTREERANPEIINGSRRTRIAKGSGTEVSDVNRLIKQFLEMQKMMKRMGGMAKPQGKAGKGKSKVNKRQLMREVGDMLGGQGGIPGLPGADGSPGLPPFFK